jgi:hypothetical protein
LTSPAAALITTIATEGTFEASFGLADGGDFFEGTTKKVIAATDFLSNISVISQTPASVTMGNYDAGLSALDNNTTDIVFNKLVTAQDLSLHFASVSSGAFSGAADINGGVLNPITHHYSGGAYDFKDKADITVNASIVPEPFSILIWSLLAGIFGSVWFVRRR